MESNEEISPKQLKIYIHFFRHFSERLSLRYNILITLNEYIELCSQIIIVAECQREGKRITKLLGTITIEDTEVKVCNDISIPGTPLLTAFPKTHRFKIDKTWIQK